MNFCDVSYNYKHSKFLSQNDIPDLIQSNIQQHKIIIGPKLDFKKNHIEGEFSTPEIVELNLNIVSEPADEYFIIKIALSVKMM